VGNLKMEKNAQGGADEKGRLIQAVARYCGT